MAEEQEDLLLDKLIAGDRPATYAAGLVCARALKEEGIAVLMPDVLGRIHLLPMEVLEIKRRPRIPDEELHRMPEDLALQVLVKQEESEDAIVEYLKRRASVVGQEAS
jgi:hypothetical protein